VGLGRRLEDRRELESVWVCKQDPFLGASFGSVTVLSSVTPMGIGNSNQFQYNAYGEMTQFTTPLGAVLGWQYRTFVYTAGNSSRQYREVQTRTMSPAYNGSTNTWSLSLANGTGSLHGTGTVQDLGAQSEKLWTFNTSTTALAGNTPYPDALLGSLTAYDEIFTGSGGPTTLLHKDYTPWQSSGGQAYESTIVTTLNPGAGPAQTRTVQTLDNHGNLTQSQITDYAGSATGTRTYNMTYTAGSSNYAARYIFNRLLTATVTNGGSPLALVNNTYDSGCFTNGMTNTNATNSHDPAYNTSVTIRGNLSGTSGLNGSGWYCTAYDTAGVPYYSWNGTQSVAIQTDSTTDYSLPTAIQPNSNSDMQTSATYASSWAPTSLTGPNGDQGTTTYDSYGRPAQTTIPDGAVTTYTYAYYNSATQSGANSQTATLDGRWQTTTLDGFGRTIHVQTGNGSTTVSTVDTQYAPCACSPLGKMSAVSEPYAPGGTPVWTTYTYDASGRTLTVTAPDGSTTRYAYQGNNTTVTDPAGKWKTSIVDAYGNPIVVTEPNPAGGAFATNYTYTLANQLTTVSMTRGNVTQTRTFLYGGSDLISATNPENGTVTYTYDGAHHVTSRTDALGEQTQYSYDFYGRLSEAQYYPCSVCDETTADRVTYYYDGTVPANLGNGYGQWGGSPPPALQNTIGRLSAVTFNGGINDEFNDSYYYLYSYTPPGRVGAQMMGVQAQPVHQLSAATWLTFSAAYQWDNEGRMTSLQYPTVQITGWGNYPGVMPTAGYQYDANGRLGANAISSKDVSSQSGTCPTTSPNSKVNFDRAIPFTDTLNRARVEFCCISTTSACSFR